MLRSFFPSFCRANCPPFFAACVTAFLLSFLSACSKEPEIPYASPALSEAQAQAPAQPQAQPVPAQAVAAPAPAAGHSTTDMLLAAGAGYLLGSSNASSAPAVQQAPPVIRQTIVRKTIVQAAPAPKAAPPVPKPQQAAKKPAMTYKPASPARPSFRPAARRK